MKLLSVDDGNLSRPPLEAALSKHVRRTWAENGRDGLDRFTGARTAARFVQKGFYITAKSGYFMRITPKCAGRRPSPGRVFGRSRKEGVCR